MHQFCCISTVSENSQASHKHFTDHLPAIRPPTTIMWTTSSNRFDPLARSNPAQVNGNHNYINSNNNHNGGSANSTEPNQRLSQRAEPVDVKINDLVGNGIAGVLYKWVNYGKGWRPRWFVLQDGVLSYYKIHGRDKIVVSQETEKGCKIIGEESMRRIHRRCNKYETHQHHLHRKPFGEIHLKVFRFLLFLLKKLFQTVLFLKYLKFISVLLLDRCRQSARANRTTRDFQYLQAQNDCT